MLHGDSGCQPALRREVLVDVTDTALDRPLKLADIVAQVTETLIELYVLATVVRFLTDEATDLLLQFGVADLIAEIAYRVDEELYAVGEQYRHRIEEVAAERIIAEPPALQRVGQGNVQPARPDIERIRSKRTHDEPLCLGAYYCWLQHAYWGSCDSGARDTPRGSGTEFLLAVDIVAAGLPIHLCRGRRAFDRRGLARALDDHPVAGQSQRRFQQLRRIRIVPCQRPEQAHFLLHQGGLLPFGEHRIEVDHFRRRLAPGRHELDGIPRQQLHPPGYLGHLTAGMAGPFKPVGEQCGDHRLA